MSWVFTILVMETKLCEMFLLQIEYCVMVCNDFVVLCRIHENSDYDGRHTASGEYCTNTHSHTHTHTLTRTRTHAHTHAHARIQVFSYTCGNLCV